VEANAGIRVIVFFVLVGIVTCILSPFLIGLIWISFERYRVEACACGHAISRHINGMDQCEVCNCRSVVALEECE